MQTRKEPGRNIHQEEYKRKTCIAVGGRGEPAVKGATFWISIAIANSGRKLNYPIVNILIYSDVELEL